MHCTKRYFDCHATCEEYKKSAAQIRNINEKIRKENEYTFVGTKAFCLKRKGNATR